MNINISNKFIEKLARFLFISGRDDLYGELQDIVKNSEPKEINYKNYGKQVKEWSAIKGFITNTKLNHFQLERDDCGQFLPIYKKIYTFKYNSPHTGIKDREIELVEKDETYLVGKDKFDDNKIKNFRRDRVIGRVKVTKIKI